MKIWLLRKKQNLVDNPKINPWFNGWDMAHIESFIPPDPGFRRRAHGMMCIR